MNQLTRTAPQADEKQSAILAAAVDAFAQYGFRRVSMEDIAQRAGMSRAALYLHFRNKEAIFSQITRDYFALATTAMAAALADNTDPVLALKAGFAAKVAPPFDQLMESPHGEELLDKAAVSSEVVAEGEAMVRAALTDWLDAACEAGRVSLEGLGDSAQVARVLLNALHGAISAAPSYAALLDELDRQATILGRGLTA